MTREEDSQSEGESEDFDRLIGLLNKASEMPRPESYVEFQERMRRDEILIVLWFFIVSLICVCLLIIAYSTLST